MPLKSTSIASCLALLMLSGDIIADTSPVEHFAKRDAIRSVRVSPDGTKLLQLAVPEADGDVVLEIYDTDDLAAEPLRKSAEPWEMTAAHWAGDQDVVIELGQPPGNDRRTADTRVALFDLSGDRLRILDVRGALMENMLPHDADQIIISSASTSTGDELMLLPVEFRSRDYYKIDIHSGESNQLLAGQPLIGSVSFDEFGSPWLARGFDAGKGEFVWSRYVDGDWQEFFRQHEDIGDAFDVYGNDPDNSDYVIVGAQNGHDKIGIWTFNSTSGEFGELIYRRNDVDIVGVRYHSNHWTKQGAIAGIEYFGDKFYYEYFDEFEAAGYAQIDGLIRNAYSTSISSRSKDADTMVVWNEAPTDPGSLYIVHNALLKKIGSRQPLLEGKQLATVEYITFDTRDNREIAAFLTRPHGEGPHPLVVMPHDGPFERQIVIYDAWAQMLADNGYLVLQPQFRGSRGYGVEYSQAAFVGGGQGGYSMQDDKDDGARFLVGEGLADKDRIAVFGWGYGGYAALVAASRTPQTYQCVAAAAAVPDTEAQASYYRENSRGRDRRQYVSFWMDSINPLDEVEQVNVPVLLIHGSDDRQVLPSDIFRYVSELERAGKSHMLVELEGAGHSSETLTVANTEKLFAELIRFLAEDCF